jgi:hypothetical protein
MKEKLKTCQQAEDNICYLESVVTDEIIVDSFLLVHFDNVFRFLTAYSRNCCKYEFAHMDKIYMYIKLSASM